MGFEVLAPESSGRPRLSRADNVVVALDVTRKGGRSTNEHLDIRIGADLLGRLDWSIGANLLLAEGRDTDLGRCEIRRAPLDAVSRVLSLYSGIRSGQDGRLRWPVSTFRYHRLTSTSVNPMVVMHEVRGSTLVLSLPIWLAVPQPAPAMPAPSAPPQQLL